mmetsp:Transcript_3762/g.5498  ORF Transcript_3762/g.5498 Transcript_3762/m.5498 type:complete len:122 (+) Transcript_3762:14-379(+)
MTTLLCAAYRIHASTVLFVFFFLLFSVPHHAAVQDTKLLSIIGRRSARTVVPTSVLQKNEAVEERTKNVQSRRLKPKGSKIHRLGGTRQRKASDNEHWREQCQNDASGAWTPQVFFGCISN